MPDRDLDRLLETFADLTDRVPPHARVTRRAWLLGRFVVFAVTSIVIVVIGIAGLVYLPQVAPPGADRIALPTHRDLESYAAALLTGRLVREGECVYADSLTGSGRNLVVWPSGTALVENDSETIIVERGGKRIAALGEPVELAGGEIPRPHLDTVLETEIPAECSGPFWLASSATSPLGEARPATWRVDPQATVQPETTRLSVLLREIECANGLTPAGRIAPPDVEYGAEAITITLSVRTWLGDCPSNPEYSYVVELAEPVGQRMLIDGFDGEVRWVATAQATPVPPTPALPSLSPTPSPEAEPEPAPWSVDAAAPIGPESTSVRLLVRHDSCVFGFETIGSALPAEIAYSSEAVAITVPVLPHPDLELCERQWEDRIVVPILVELAEPLGNRVLVDGSQDPPRIRWRTPPPDALRLPTKQTAPWPLGKPFSGACAGVGLNGRLAGSADDPRLVWVEDRSGRSNSEDRWVWPPGFTVRFENGVEVLNEAGEVVHRGGDEVDSACVIGDIPYLSLYGGAFFPDPIPPATPPPYPVPDLVGRLQGTDLAGPCSFVVNDGGWWTVVWPDGYRIDGSDHEDPVLIGPRGAVVAAEGDLIGLSGYATGGMSPVCMTGQIFEATEVAFVEREPSG